MIYVGLPKGRLFKKSKEIVEYVAQTPENCGGGGL